MAPTKGAASAHPEVLHEPLALPDAVRPALLDACMAPTKLKLAAIGVALVLAFGAGWAVQGWRMGATLAKQETAQAKAAQAQTQQALVATETKASARIEHAGKQQDNTHVYTQKLRELEAARIADAGRIERLQHDL